MANQVVRCPETRLPQIVAYEDSPFGMLLTACTRFRPAGAVTCSRQCGAWLDQAGREATGCGRGGHEAPTDRVARRPLRPFTIDAVSLLRRGR